MRNTVIMILLAILAAALWLATWQRQEAAPIVERAEDAEPLGYYMLGAHFSGTDEQGRVTSRVFAERLDELPGDQRLRLTGVKVEHRPAGDLAWSLSAASAISAKDVSQLDLIGNVEVRSSPADGSGPWTIRTDALHFRSDTSKAESRAPVEIDVGDWRFAAGVLRMDLKGETLELESEVHGTLLP